MQVSRRAFLAVTIGCVGLAACGGATAAPATSVPPSPATAKPSTGAAPSPSSAAAKPSTSSAASPAAPASAAAAKTPVKFAWTMLTANQLVVPLALEAGYFAKYGIDLALSYTQSSTTAVPALLAGDFDAATMGGSACVGAQAGGSDLVMVTGHVNQAMLRVMAMPGIDRIEDLRGKTVGVTSVGTTDYWGWRAIIEKYGWKDNDLKFLPAKDVAGQVSVLQRGDAQAIAVGPPNDVLAERVGAHQILDTASMGIPSQQNGITLSRKLLAAKRPAIMNVVKASIEGIHRWKTDAAFAKSVIAKYLKTEDQRVIDVGYDAYAPIYPKVPYPSREGLAEIVKQVSIDNPKAKGLNFEQLTDTSLVKELEDSGFIAQVYGA
ncbi:MAG TPA: ABC transporter substrate-binding protein [Chloroflexota bacterium]|nr:ABC transporter substrate-binding protein [Chloroflexota bacterium]